MQHKTIIREHITFAAECSCDWEGDSHTFPEHAHKEANAHVEEKREKLLREAVIDAFSANGLIVSGTEVDMIVKAALGAV